MKNTCSINAAVLVLVGLCLTSVVGCGGSDYDLVSVSGRVTLDGAGLAGARVMFNPSRSGGGINAGPGSFAETDTDGNFTLKTIDDLPGAVVGRHRVVIRTSKGEVDPTAENEFREITPERVPEKFRDGSQTFDVPEGGTDAANFTLVSDASTGS